MTLYRIIVSGDSGMVDYAHFRRIMIESLKGRMPSKVELVTSSHKGAETLTKKFSSEFKMKIKEFRLTDAQQRNTAKRVESWIDMIEYSDAGIFFWDGHDPEILAFKNMADSAQLWVRTITDYR